MKCKHTIEFDDLGRCRGTCRKAPPAAPPPCIHPCMHAKVHASRAQRKDTLAYLQCHGVHPHVMQLLWERLKEGKSSLRLFGIRRSIHEDFVAYPAIRIACAWAH
eukprot:352965-Chlamydomonas_euryale.AAC.4